MYILLLVLLYNYRNKIMSYEVISQETFENKNIMI